MRKLDLGFLSNEQFYKLIKHLRHSNVKLIEIHALKFEETISVVLNFRSKQELDKFIVGSHMLVKDLKGVF